MNSAFLAELDQAVLDVEVIDGEVESGCTSACGLDMRSHDECIECRIVAGSCCNVRQFGHLL